jgi:hypothetical protein
MHTPILFSNGISLTLAEEEGCFLGIGAVAFHGAPLRNPALPWTIYTESEHGVRFEAFRLVGVTEDGATATITFTGEGRWLPRIQEADAMGDARVKARRLQAPTITFHWHFRAITEQIFEQEWTGLAMQVEIDAPGYPMHWLLESTTWEIGGAAEGCTLIQQDVSVIDLEQTVHADSAFSTIERFLTEGAGAWGGSFPMDMLPRAAGAAICDFQVKDELALLLFSERPSLTRARLEKFADENVIHYLDRPFFPLTEHACAPERKLLVYRHAAPLARHEWRNLWLDAFTEVRRRIQATYGFHLEIPEPTVSAHLWDDDLRAYGPAWTTPLEAALPEYRRLGYLSDVYHTFDEPMSVGALAVEGTFGAWTPTTATVRATFADGRPAMLAHRLGQGQTLCLAFEVCACCATPDQPGFQQVLAEAVLDGRRAAWTCPGAYAFRRRVDTADYYYVINTGEALSTTLLVHDTAYRQVWDVMADTPVPVATDPAAIALTIPAGMGVWLRCERE